MIFERLAAALRAAQPVALVTRLDGAAIGAKLLVFSGETLGTLGHPRLDEAATAEALARLAGGENAIRSFGEEGEPIGNDVRLFIRSYAPKPDMYIFGAIDFSRAMAQAGKTLGYRVTVVDARPPFATRARIPDADEVIVAWPDEFLATARVDERSALIVLTHDVKFDVPLLQLAVRTPAGYIGAMGSRNTHANRIAALRAAGVDDAALARIFAPVGLDIGARTPEETAVSIAAEIIAVREGRAGGHLARSGAPIHNPRATAPA